MDAVASIATAIAALEAQRAVLGHAVVDAALAPLQRELERLRAQREPDLPRQQLKQVSVLFVDVVGSTSIGQRLDPEEIHAVMDRALERFTAAVHTHHGRVLQYTGDGMLAAFGADASREDDAESAIRAGLAIIAAAREHAVTVQRQFGIDTFNVRAGVHTGRVLLGAGVDAEGSIRGATVNIAARMEQTAPPGALRISHDTWRQVRGLFETSEMEAVKVKGVEQPLRTYLVQGARPHGFVDPTRGIEGVATRMIGRDAELDALGQAFAQAAQARERRAVTVVGEPGLGKSRLLAEFRSRLDEADQPCVLLLARAHPRSPLHPYGLVRDLFAWHLGLPATEDAAAMRAAYERGLAPLLAEPDEAAVHALGHLLGLDYSASAHLQDMLDDEAALRERGFAAAFDALRRLAESRLATVVVVFDDLHWADAASLAFAREMLTRLSDVSLLAVFLTRSTLFEAVPDWSADDPRHRRIDLLPLDGAGSRELAASLLRRMADVPDALRAIVTGGAEGNPFYMEELVKMLIDDGVIVVEGADWRVHADRLLAAKVPPTLTGVLQARLDALPGRERQALQQAAIAGHLFWDQVLAAIDPAAVAALPALARRALIHPRDDRPGAPAGEFAFQHQLLHQVTYDSVLKRRRQDGHARAGDFWRARAEVTSALEVTPEACRALAEAHDHCTRADPLPFVDWFESQYTAYLNAYAGRTLHPLAESVLALCEQRRGTEHAQTARALTNLARLKLQQRDAPAAERLLSRALTIQQRELGEDHPDTARTLTALGAVHQARGEPGAAEPYFRRALAVRERMLGADDRLTLGTVDHLAGALIELGRLDEAEPLLQRVLDVHERLAGPDHPDTASAMTALAEVQAKRGDLVAAEAQLRRALAVQELKLGSDHVDVGMTLWHLAETLRLAGRPAEAEPLARRMLALVQTAFGDDHEWAGWAAATLAGSRLALGDAAEAAALAGRAATVFERHFGHAHAQVTAMHDLARQAAAPALALAGTPVNGS